MEELEDQLRHIATTETKYNADVRAGMRRFIDRSPRKVPAGDAR